MKLDTWGAIPFNGIPLADLLHFLPNCEHSEYMYSSQIETGTCSGGCCCLVSTAGCCCCCCCCRLLLLCCAFCFGGLNARNKAAAFRFSREQLTPIGEEKIPYRTVFYIRGDSHWSKSVM